jgi:hypothetical protein
MNMLPENISSTRKKPLIWPASRLTFIIMLLYVHQIMRKPDSEPLTLVALYIFRLHPNYDLK